MRTEISGIEPMDEGIFGADLWGFDGSRGRMRSLTSGTAETDDSKGRMRTIRGGTGETDESDFTPAQLELMKHNNTTQAAPLPQGVRDIQWKPPTLTGLEHSTPIFETESNMEEGSLVTSKKINGNNCHFRSWQEDNGVATTFASKRVEKNVDGQTRTVLISPAISMRMSMGSVMAVMESDLRSKLRSSPSDSSAEESGEEDGVDAGQGNVARAILSPADKPNNRTPLILRRPSADAVSDAAEAIKCTQPNTIDADLVIQSTANGSPCPSTTGSTEGTSPIPRRPTGESKGNQRQQQRPGRSLSTKVVGSSLYFFRISVEIRRVTAASQVQQNRGCTRAMPRAIVWKTPLLAESLALANINKLLANGLHNKKGGRIAALKTLMRAEAEQASQGHTSELATFHADGTF